MLDEIYRLCPDIVIMNLTMQGIDGIGILRRMKQEPPRKIPITILLVDEGQRIEASEAFLLGAKYCMIRPIDYLELEDRIRDQIEQMRSENGKSSENLIAKIREIVNKIGAPAHRLGYKYLIDAVALFLEHKDSVYPARDLYEDVAANHNTTWKCVESNLRNTIGQICDQSNNIYREIFFSEKGKDACKLSNYKMISILAEYVKLNSI